MGVDIASNGNTYRALVLTEGGVNHTFQYVLLGRCRVKVFDQEISFLYIIYNSNSNNQLKSSQLCMERRQVYLKHLVVPQTLLISTIAL